MTWERQQAYAYRDGKEEGIAEGSRTKALEAARNAIAMKLSVEQASQLTGLPVAEVQQLAAELS